MAEEWANIKKELGLYQTQGNSMWYTDKPVFCSFTKKQIFRGVAISILNEFVGICDMSYFIQDLKVRLFVDNDIVHIIGITSHALPIKKTAKKERSVMTDGLRYKILKRDDFKCRACGLRAGDGELNIDHIIPVSKGGKTIERNLQVLCKKCNTGKSNVH